MGIMDSIGHLAHQANRYAIKGTSQILNSLGDSPAAQQSGLLMAIQTCQMVWDLSWAAWDLSWQIGGEISQYAQDRANSQKDAAVIGRLRKSDCIGLDQNEVDQAFKRNSELVSQVAGEYMQCFGRHYSR
jgi:hypothetical protein